MLILSSPERIIWLSLTIMICHWLTTSQTFLQTPIPAVGSLMLINPLIPNADFSILANPPSKWTLNRSGHLINAMTAHLMNDQCAKHFWSALLKDRARDMFLPCRFCKKTEIAQIRLPWGRHDFSLQFDFSGINDFFAGGQPNLQEKRSTVPPGASLGSRCLDGTCLSSNLLALRCIENCGTKAPEYMTRKPFQGRGCKTAAKQWSIHINHTDNTHKSPGSCCKIWQYIA